MLKQIEKQVLGKKILPTLRELPLYETEVWPIGRMTVVNATIQKVKLESGKAFTYKTDREKGTIEVRRIK